MGINDSSILFPGCVCIYFYFFAVLPIMILTPHFDTMTMPLPSGTNLMIYHQNTVIVVSGESGRQVFFSAKGLDLTAGFKILSGAVCITVLI